MSDILKPTPREVLLNLVAKRRQVIYGAQATNYHLHSNLRKDTKDYDILTKDSKKSAEELANELNRHYKDRFKVEPAKYHKTWKVKDTKTGENFADYTQTKKFPDSHNELGVRYAGLKYAKGKLKQALSNPDASYRHEKDRDTLNRINISRKNNIW